MKRVATQSALVLSALLALGFSTIAAAGSLPPLETGDIVFQNSASGARDAIMLASRTQYTHVGLVEIDAAGRAVVIEAVGPVRTIALEDWIRKGRGHRVTIKRIKGLTGSEAAQAVARARHYMGRPYDHYFYESRDRIYCSELIHAAFKEGASISVGREERLSDLNIGNAAARKLIRKRWRSHPLCQAKGAATFERCLPLILEQTLVTPASIAADQRMELVYTDFGPDAE
jgi:hypothetical protein